MFLIVILPPRVDHLFASRVVHIDVILWLLVDVERPCFLVFAFLYFIPSVL